MMASLDDKIAALETEIGEYRELLRAAETSEERKDLILATITARSNTQNLLLTQKNQQGK
jgi:hypothetical protein